MRKVIATLVALTLLSGTANAATTTKKPTPTPTKKVTAAPKVTAKATATATKKPVVKKVYKPKPRKKVKVTPSPSVKWPPSGYTQNGDIFAKVPTSKELIGFASSNTTLAKQLQTCEINACGALLAASTAGCNWWEFNADVVGPTSETDSTLIKYGSVTTLYNSSKPKQIMPFLLISQEPIKSGVKVSGIKIACHREPIPTDLKVPSNTYVK